MNHILASILTNINSYTKYFIILLEFIYITCISNVPFTLTILFSTLFLIFFNKIYENNMIVELIFYLSEETSLPVFIEMWKIVAEH